jgi:hypothetical protein
MCTNNFHAPHRSITVNKTDRFITMKSTCAYSTTNKRVESALHFVCVSYILRVFCVNFTSSHCVCVFHTFCVCFVWIWRVPIVCVFQSDSLDPSKFTFENFFHFYQHLTGRTEVDTIFDEMCVIFFPLFNIIMHTLCVLEMCVLFFLYISLCEL